MYSGETLATASNQGIIKFEILHNQSLEGLNPLLSMQCSPLHIKKEKVNTLPE